MGSPAAASTCPDLGPTGHRPRRFPPRPLAVVPAKRRSVEQLEQVQRPAAVTVIQQLVHIALPALGERGPSDDLRLQFEAVSQFPEEERKIVKALLEGMIIKFQTKQMVGNLSS